MMTRAGPVNGQLAGDRDFCQCRAMYAIESTEAAWDPQAEGHDRRAVTPTSDACLVESLVQRSVRAP